MVQAIDEVRIPNRFESLQRLFGEVRPLIFNVEEDLRAFIGFRARAQTQNGGILCFPLGPSGIGKTTAIYSVVSTLPDAFGRVHAAPHDLPVRDLMAWVVANASVANNGKSSIILLDGRELSDDTPGIKQSLASLNQFLRLRSDVICCWPMTDPGWHSQVKNMARTIVGSNLCPAEGDYYVKGPSRKDWQSVLERMLLQFGKTIEDVALASDLIQDWPTDRIR